MSVWVPISLATAVVGVVLASWALYRFRATRYEVVALRREVREVFKPKPKPARPDGAHSLTGASRPIRWTDMQRRLVAEARQSRRHAEAPTEQLPVISDAAWPVADTESSSATTTGVSYVSDQVG